MNCGAGGAGADTRTGAQAHHSGPKDRQGARGVDSLARVHNLTAGDSRATIHDGGLLPEVF